MPARSVSDLVLAGGGHAHALLLRQWAERPPDGLRLTLVSPQTHATYSGMLPGLVAGHYRRHQLEIDLSALARAAGARFVRDAVIGIDPAQRRIRLEHAGHLAYDLLSLDIGASSTAPEIPGFGRHGLSAKPFPAFFQGWNTWLDGLEQGRLSPDIALAGAGPAGVELALAMRFRLKARRQPAGIRLLDAGEALRGLPPRARSLLLKALRDRDIQLLEHCRIAEIQADHIEVEGAGSFPASLVVGAAGARAHGWLARDGLETVGGYVAVGETLQSRTDPSVFACGDCAHLTHAPRPKAGVFAVRAAPVLAHNLQAAATGGRMRPFLPQADYLKLIALGDKTAMAERNGVALSGGWIWQLKDRIDRRFMRRVQMPPDRPPSPAETEGQPPGDA